MEKTTFTKINAVIKMKVLKKTFFAPSDKINGEIFCALNKQPKVSTDKRAYY